MKNVKKIKLHNLSQAEMADKEMNLLKGGSGLPGYCISICLDAICKCAEDGSGVFTTDNTTHQTYDTSTILEDNVATNVQKNTAGNAGGSGVIR